MLDEIKAGSKVRYISIEESMSYSNPKHKVGEVVALLTITDHKAKEYIGGKIGLVGYNEGCKEDMVFLKDMELIKQEGQVMDNIKPPLGLTPKHIWCGRRLLDIKEAIKRYVEVNKPIPAEWITEYNELAEIISNEENPLAQTKF